MPAIDCEAATKILSHFSLADLLCLQSALDQAISSARSCDACPAEPSHPEAHPARAEASS
jgi:hypothetical protein